MKFKRGILRSNAGSIELIIRLIDLALIALTGTFAVVIRQPEIHDTTTLYGAAILIGALVSALVFPLFDIYHSWRGRRLLNLVVHIAAAWGLVLLILTALSFITGSSENYSRLWFAYWAFGGMGALAAVRVGMFFTLRWMRRRGLNERRVLIVGAGVLGVEIVDRLLAERWTGFKAVGFLDDDASKWGANFHQTPVLGGINDVDDWVRREDVDEIWIALPLRVEQRVREVLHLLRHSTVSIRFVPDIFSFRLLNHKMSEVVGLPIIDLASSPMTGVNRLIKAVEDRVLATLFLFLASPVMLLIAAGVKLSSPGPVFFRQERIGWNGKSFTMLKFRSMPISQEGSAPVWGSAHAKAQTPFGRFLRKTSLDELPQLINVLRGEMSIVGPRPERSEFVEQFKHEIDGYM
ncbi:MAG: exopolysaccharide biosynthesis polyprenyl glycosylphosphotransferase, partial [Thermodesulfobacteriota bacterium]